MVDNAAFSLYFISCPKLVELNKICHAIVMQNRGKFAQNQEPSFSGIDHRIKVPTLLLQHLAS